MENVEKDKKRKLRQFERELKKQLFKSQFNRGEKKEKKPKSLKQRIWQGVQVFCMANFVFFFVFDNYKSISKVLSIPETKEVSKPVEAKSDVAANNQTSKPTLNSTLGPLNSNKSNDDIFSEGDKLVNEKKYNEAIDAFNKIITTDSNNIHAYKRLVNVYLILGKDNEVYDTCNKIISINSQDDVAYGVIGDIKLKEKNFDEAYTYYSKAIGLKTNNISIYNNMAYVLVKQQKYDEALAIYDNGLKINPSDKQLIDNRQSLINFINSK